VAHECTVQLTCTNNNNNNNNNNNKHDNVYGEFQTVGAATRKL